MTTVIFDTYKAVGELREAGFNEAQAAAMVTTMCNVLGVNLATKEDLAIVRQDMATKADIAAVRLEIAAKEDFAAVRREIATKEDFAAIRQEMVTKADLHAMADKLTIRMGGMIFGAAGLVLAILRFFPNFLG